MAKDLLKILTYVMIPCFVSCDGEGTDPNPPHEPAHAGVSVRGSSSSATSLGGWNTATRSTAGGSNFGGTSGNSGGTTSNPGEGGSSFGITNGSGGLPSGSSAGGAPSSFGGSSALLSNVAGSPSNVAGSASGGSSFFGFAGSAGYAGEGLALGYCRTASDCANTGFSFCLLTGCNAGQIGTCALGLGGVTCATMLANDSAAVCVVPARADILAECEVFSGYACQSCKSGAAGAAGAPLPSSP